jgi:transcriptional regulator with XRE-family HTH domain
MKHKIYSPIITQFLIENNWVNYSQLAAKVGYNRTNISLIQRGKQVCPEHIAERIYKLFQETSAGFSRQLSEAENETT